MKMAKNGEKKMHETKEAQDNRGYLDGSSERNIRFLWL